MIIILKENVAEDSRQKLLKWLSSANMEFKETILNGVTHIVAASAWKSTPAFAEYQEIIENIINFDTEYQLSSRKFQPDNTLVSLGADLTFGSNKTIIMAGPGVIVSETQAMRTAEFLSKKFNIKIFRAGTYKRRTSPYSSRDWDEKGLMILEKVRNEFGMKISTEVKDQTHLKEITACADLVEISANSMYLLNLLAHHGPLTKPILLKRSFMSTIKEFLQAADFILATGNPQVILCERGVRTFEPQTRSALDLCSLALLKETSHLPVVLDPGLAPCRAAQVPLVTRATAALGVDGLLVTTQPGPLEEAKSHPGQTLSFEEFAAMIPDLQPICKAVGRILL
jgi:3-deoxy-7-phosphoheptulonate synthase